MALLFDPNETKALRQCFIFFACFTQRDLRRRAITRFVDNYIDASITSKADFGLQITDVKANNGCYVR